MRVGADWSRWYSFGSWSSAEGRSSVNGQKDRAGPGPDRYVTPEHQATTYQYRVTLRGQGTTARLLAFATSDRARAGRRPGGGQRPGRLGQGDLDVPQRSQMMYPDGGEMLVQPHQRLDDSGGPYGVERARCRSAARATYDRAYDGTGNWSFNAAYAAALGHACLRDPPAEPCRRREVHGRRRAAGRQPGLEDRANCPARPIPTSQRPPDGAGRL